VRAPRDGVVRIFRDRSGRNGKVVTVIHGLPAKNLDERYINCLKIKKRLRKDKR